MLRLEDSYGRTFSYLRLSLTEACNFRCQYCLVNGYKPRALCGDPFEDTLLSSNEIEMLVSGFAVLGFRKVRLSGGEPTLRKDLIEIVRRIAAIPEIEVCALTTNGFRIKELAEQLHAAGLNALNISLDSLDPESFRQITGSHLFERVFEGILEAQRVGIKRVKLNVVALKSFMQSDLPVFKELLRDSEMTVRFIELMETCDNSDFFRREHVDLGEMRASLDSEGWRAADRHAHAGPAREFAHPQYRGKIGVIAPYSPAFCAGCNRLRVSSRGKLRLCLFGDGEISLRHLLQSPAQRGELVSSIQHLITWKPNAHRLTEGVSGDTRTLSAIGG